MTDYISREEAIMAVTRAKLPDVTPDGIPIANGKRSVTDCIRRIKEIPSAEVVPWKDLMRYASYFCAAVSYTEFVREAKMFFDNITNVAEGSE